jgi:hypothetical protein
MMKSVVIFGIVLAASLACDKENHHYTVVGRTNPQGNPVLQVPVVLEHSGTRYYAQCNNIKGVQGSNVPVGCNLHVGMIVECQLFGSRASNGYDLICGNKRNAKGEVDTFGENELLLVDREEAVR